MADIESVINGLECCHQINQTECFRCPYARGNGCTYALMGDVLALLKAQEPRVMALSEMNDRRGRGEAVYYEDRDVTARCQHVFLIASVGEYAYIKCEVYTLAKRVDEYGITWRCWTAKPDEKTRVETPWDSGVRNE